MTSGPRSCSYLPAEQATLLYRLYPGLSPAELEELIRRGWRRFTTGVFRHACARCQKCLSVRVPVAAFTPSKSQRRVLKKNEHIRVVVQPPTVSEDHIRLYNAWHAQREEARGWDAGSTSEMDYVSSFLMGEFPSLHEMLYFDGDQLRGVGLVEVLPHALSSVYFFFDPEWSPLSPGTFSALCELNYAQAQGLNYVYFGYWVAECPSLAYKNRFQPYEVLQGLPADDEEPVWVCQAGIPGDDERSE